MNALQVEVFTAVSLSPWEEQALASIGAQLTGTDPELAALLDTFSRLAEDELMPLREPVRGQSRRLPRLPRLSWFSWLSRRPRRAKGRWIGQAALLLLVAISVTVIAVAVSLSSGGGRTSCTSALPLVCPSSVSPHPPSPARLGSGRIS